MIVLSIGCVSQKPPKVKISEKLVYRPLSEFNGDTAQYLNYNFVDHKNQYIGKPASLVLNKLELEIKSYIP